jgi:hypothetical protein
VIDQQAEAQRVADVKIQQKLGLAHREAFQQKFPGQVEHCMRLIAERLQLGLRKDNPQTLSAEEIRDLTASLHTLVDIQRNYM